MNKNCCVYFTGPRDKACLAGVEYRALVGGDNFGWLNRMPCFADHKTEIICNYRRFPTQEELLAWDKKAKARMEGISSAIKAIRAKHDIEPSFKPWPEKSEQGFSGIIECPACKGRLHYSVSPRNHHIWGQCETQGCLSWMM